MTRRHCSDYRHCSVLDQSAVRPPKDLMAIPNVVTPPADWEVDHFADFPLEGWAAAQIAVLPPEDSVVVQVYSQRVDSQELVLCPEPRRLPASKTRRPTELLVTSSA